MLKPVPPCSHLPLNLKAHRFAALAYFLPIGLRARPEHALQEIRTWSKPQMKAKTAPPSCKIPACMDSILASLSAAPVRRLAELLLLDFATNTNGNR